MEIINHQFIKFNQLDNSSLESLLIDNLNQVMHGLEQVKQTSNLTWHSLQHMLYNHLYELNQIWGLIGHLESVNSSQQLRELRDKYQNQITRFYVSLGQSTELYRHLQQIKQSEYANLGVEDKKIIDNEFRDFKLSGIELNPQQQEQFKNIQERLTELTTKFEQNVLDATDSYSKFVTEEELNGMPADLLAQYKHAAINDNKPELYKITLHMPSYFPVMEHCQNRQLREELYYHYTTRASELGDIELNNSPIISDILRLRNDKAKLLGFADFTELSFYTKMAKNSTQVLEFLDQLNTKSHAHAIADFTELSEFAKTELNLDNLQAWDVPYVSQKLQMHKYSYSNWELKQYFQLNKVLDGLFKLIFNLYQIEFKLNKAIPTWDCQMLTYEVVRDSVVIGSLYLDLFARTGKQPGAWMNSLQDKFITDEINKQPLAGIMCNFTPPLMGSDIVILTFDEVQTLFHEMGHALHHLLTKINHFSISGINGVEWDAVELPSQFMEYFTWNREILNSISCHVETNQPIPDELYTKMINGRHYQSGLMMARQLEFAILDIMLHKNKNFTIEECYKTTEIVRKKVAVIIPPDYNRFLNSFSHIFAGGYASGYYSYKWAEVLAADIFHKFDAIIDQNYSDLGQKFYNELLSQGGLKPMLENFVSFVGREPQIDALLKYSGIA